MEVEAGGSHIEWRDRGQGFAARDTRRAGFISWRTRCMAGLGAWQLKPLMRSEAEKQKRERWLAHTSALAQEHSCALASMARLRAHA